MQTLEVSMEDRSARTWVWASLLLQALGYGFDAVWHGLLHPGVEPTTRSAMVRHLGTVHLPLYMGQTQHSCHQPLTHPMWL